MVNSKKIAKKLEILKKKETLWRHFKRKYFKILKKIEIKITVPFRSYPMRNWKFKKNSKKKLKNTIMDSFQAILGWKRTRKREDKNYRSVLFQPDA